MTKYQSLTVSHVKYPLKTKRLTQIRLTLILIVHIMSIPSHPSFHHQRKWLTAIKVLHHHASHSTSLSSSAESFYCFICVLGAKVVVGVVGEKENFELNRNNSLYQKNLDNRLLKLSTFTYRFNY